MDQKIEKILQDIYLIAPDLRDKEEELKKTVEKLLASKPERELDPQFKKELLEKILEEYEKKGTQQPIKRAFYLRPAFLMAAAVAMVIIVLNIIYFLPEDTTSPPPPPITIAAKNQTQETGIQHTETPEFPSPAHPEKIVKIPAPISSKPVTDEIKKSGVKKSRGDLEVILKAKDGTMLPGATIMLSGKKNEKKTNVSNENGVGTFKDLSPGVYNVKVALDGFSHKTREGIHISGKQKVSIEIPMEPIDLSESIIVAGNAPTIDRANVSPVRKESNNKSVPAPRSSNAFTKDGVNINSIRKKSNNESASVPAYVCNAPTIDRALIDQRNLNSVRKDSNSESYENFKDNSFLNALETPLSTFSIDVDTASYSNMRRFLMNRTLPPLDAVRIEEFINYFPYDYPLPRGNKAFSITTELSSCPWQPENQLVLIGLKGKDFKEDTLPPSNLVFLLDVSGSMGSPQKLPLLKEAFKLLTHELLPQDRVSIVVYAGSAGLVLPPTNGNNKDAIFDALNRLQAGGSTAGGQGIVLAYNIAEENLIKKGNNRVILATDGDFNVGLSSDADMVRLIEKKREKGIFLSVLGFGTGNYKDSKMEKLADKGNGNYFYIDSMMEAKKVLVHDLRKTLFTIAKDVKIQVEFNPARVKSYRLLGYENRMLKKEEFNDDTKDAGEIGAGHTVTALYEIVPNNDEEIPDHRSELKYQRNQIIPDAFKSSEIMNIKIRYKKPEAKKSVLITKGVQKKVIPLKKTSKNFRFASGVAEFGMLLRGSQYCGQASWLSVLNRAQGSLGEDKYGYRSEFIRLVKIAQDLNKNTADK